MRRLLLVTAFMSHLACGDSITGIGAYPPASAIIGPGGGMLALHRGGDTLVLLVVHGTSGTRPPVTVSLRQDPNHERAPDILPSTVVTIEPAGRALPHSRLRFTYRDSEIATGVSPSSLRVLHFRNGDWELGSSAQGISPRTSTVEAFLIIAGGTYAVGPRPPDAGT